VPTVFSKNRDRLLEGRYRGRGFFRSLLRCPGAPDPSSAGGPIRHVSGVLAPPARAIQVAALEPNMSSPAAPSILILEDQALVRAGMRELVQISEPHGRIQEASSYDEAVEKLAAGLFDIAFLDIDLKGEKSGLDVLRHMRALELDTRAIMLSGRTERELVLECISAGASGYILKDMESEGLFRRALDTVFQGSVFLPASVIGKGGFTPASLAGPPAGGVAAETLGVTGRALEALYYLCLGLPNKTIATRMGVEEGTVRKDHIPKLFRIFKVARRTELLVEISRRGIRIPKPGSDRRGG
jgi:two-component system nitrate/nitrite response regulator NarL